VFSFSLAADVDEIGSVTISFIFPLHFAPTVNKDGNIFKIGKISVVAIGRMARCANIDAANILFEK
jgi:hypothetical protein